MVLFNTVMQNEKIAVIALVVIIVGALSVFLAATYGEDILNNLFQEEKTIELGDCADVNYIGTLVDGTVFDSSYTYPDNKTGGTPLNIFVTMNKSEAPPTEYPQYSSDLIEGFMEGLVGLKAGETATIGPIPPEKAYGANKLGIGDTFSTSNLAMVMNQTVEVIELTDESISLKWIGMDDLGNFTMPQMIIKNLSSLDQNEMVIYPPPYYLWENSSKIINIADETVEVKLTPTKGTNISKDIQAVQYNDKIIFILPDATTAVWNDTGITLTTSPEVGNNYTYSQDTGYDIINMTLTIESIVNDTINISILYDGEKSYQLSNKTLNFNRTCSMPRLYKDIPSMYQEYIFGQDIIRAGYSMHELAGKELIFEVTIENVYKTS